jgi:hypothetical protein
MTSPFAQARSAAHRLTRVLRKTLGTGSTSYDGRTTRRPDTAQVNRHRPARDYPGDFVGVPPLSYAPRPDGRPDPGEIVWGWVPFEEDYGQGKDRPVLLIGRDGPWLLGLMLTSKDHHRDAEQERRMGRLWCDIGTGEWDSRHRDSEVRVNRVIRLSESAIRREGAILPREHFDTVAAAVREAYA